MTKQTFYVSKVRPRHDGAYIGHAPDMEVEVEFPEGYDHLNDTELDPIHDAIVARLNADGWDCNTADYLAVDENDYGHQEIRERISWR